MSPRTLPSYCFRIRILSFFQLQPLPPLCYLVIISEVCGREAHGLTKGTTEKRTRQQQETVCERHLEHSLLVL